MADQARTDVNTLGEFGLIEHLTKNFKTRQKTTILGVGDDAAIIDTGGPEQLVVSTDMLVEGIHFDFAYTPLKHLGYKSVSVNVSDICAMNARPQQITVSIAISNRFSVEALDEFYEGVRAACDKYGVDLIGGDTTSSLKGLIISVTAIGRAPAERITRRSTAKVGDIICVTGHLGSAYLGLQLLEREKEVYLANPDMQPEMKEENKELYAAILRPEARTDMVDLFAKNNIIPTAMIDVSDGLASEIFHICKASGVGAILEEGNIPIKQEAQLQALEFNMDPVTVALSGGEDYELLFTIDPKDLEKVRFLPNIYISGEIVAKEDGVKLHTVGGNIHPVRAQGWEHFGE
ncbi:thiamine-phosphate kinase [Neolewinella antarctica]|uniref:Thiamine-monophosphate kinase n=1 Tax=Neolewinella antarctica TaxID=442734 RepID=A0ABX0XEG9_9BACT|nr:thiamine-phosphate kinase [Neolewinella antarctica]NJC27152.1 thiamine-monophosphate kinase [Neolewinella antarctica]